MTRGAHFGIGVLLLSLLVSSGLSADDPEEALAQLEVMTELRQVRLRAIAVELHSFSEPALVAVQAVLRISDWGNQADDPEPALTALEVIATAAEGTPVRKLALYHRAQLLLEHERRPEALKVLTQLGVEAAKELRKAEAQDQAGEQRQLRTREDELTARFRRLEEQARELREYAQQLKAQQERLHRWAEELGQVAHERGDDRERERQDEETRGEHE